MHAMHALFSLEVKYVCLLMMNHLQYFMKYMGNFLEGETSCILRAINGQHV